MRGHNYIDGTAAYQGLLRAVKLDEIGGRVTFLKVRGFFKIINF